MNIDDGQDTAEEVIGALEELLYGISCCSWDPGEVEWQGEDEIL